MLDVGGNDDGVEGVRLSIVRGMRTHPSAGGGGVRLWALVGDFVLCAGAWVVEGVSMCRAELTLGDEGKLGG